MLAWQEGWHNMGGVCVRARTCMCMRLQKHSWRACSKVPGVCVSEMCCCGVEHPRACAPPTGPGACVGTCTLGLVAGRWCP